MILKTNHNLLRQAELASNEILELREKNKSLDFKQLRTKFDKLRKQFENSKKTQEEALLEIMEEVYSICDVVVYKTQGFYLHKVQLIGAIILHSGDLAEMKTGEGKTITATLPAILNSLSKKGVHIVTVNEYLAKRDSEEMAVIYEKLGVTVGCVTKETQHLKKLEYQKDVTYITNSELGFDFLRDNMVQVMPAKLQRGFNFAIIDEADSILIDEARTPLIISGGGKPNDESYKAANAAIKKLKPKDYEFDGESKTVSLTDSGILAIEKFYKLTNMYDVENSDINHKIHNALQAHNVFSKEVEYTIRDNKIELIDIFTGRILEGRMYSNGLHQAIQAKESTDITPESVTHATITYQNLFRLYKKLSGMTGTAKTEEEEFLKIYNVRVFEIPTNKPIIRSDQVDAIYSTKKFKWDNVVKEIERVRLTGQPILVGTRSVEDSEIVHNKLKKEKIFHEVLNAKNHSREAEIIEKAGKKGSITISTNMAGRGTDIKLGEGVKAIGGLYVIGTERHESRRIDNQLRGRSGRQGDIGTSKFFISLEDEIMVRANSHKIKKIFNAENADRLESKMVSKAITSAQRRIEGMNFDTRKNVIEYDNVLNQQRQIIYKQRDMFLQSENLVEEIIIHYIETVSKEIISLPLFKDGDNLNVELFIKSMKQNLFAGEKFSKDEFEGRTNLECAEILEDKLINKFNNLYHDWNDAAINIEVKRLLLTYLDVNWQNHINHLQKLRATIEFRQYAQKKPIQIYIEESNDLFTKTREKVYHGVIKTLLNKTVIKEQELPTVKPTLK